MKKIIFKSLIFPLAMLFALILLWIILAKVIDNEFILPNLQKTMAEIFALFSNAEFYHAFFSTLFRAFIAFLISFALALIFSYLSWRSEVAKRIISPFISVVRALPTLAVALLLVFWANSKVAPVIVSMLVVLPTTFTNLKQAFDSVDNDAVKMAEFFSVSKKDVFFKVQLPQIAPALYSSIGAGLSLNLKLMVAAEVLSQTAYSLGFMLKSAQMYFEIAEMFAIVILIVIVALVIELVFSLLSKKAGKWQ
ncbi:MAG: ABC transporter permease subunit [Clostridia bacterium]|nr:ABC transporter permease subunit [Clostridia bacterium]